LQHQKQKPQQSGNLKKRLREESRFIAEVMELMVFPKVRDGDEDSDDEGRLTKGLFT
jgi:hypothetical protein